MSESISNVAIVENANNTIDVPSEESNSRSSENCEFDTAITENELVLSASQTDSLINQIVENETHLQTMPLQDITNIQPLNSEIDWKKASGPSPGMIIHNSSVTINMQQMWNERNKKFYVINWISSVLFQNWWFTLLLSFLYMNMFWLLIWKKGYISNLFALIFLYATVLLDVKYPAELNKYILLARVICEKYRFREQGISLAPAVDRNIWRSSQPVFFSQITLANRIYLYITCSKI